MGLVLQVCINFALNLNLVVMTSCILFLGEQMLLVVLGNNSGLFRTENRHQVLYKKQETIIRSKKKDAIYDLMTELG